mmetsp:Transcript_21800/g.66816  ORF Transcript_21800/g.66816 Transcript_21800/m.66816 type:complete len:217 (-) Transcript_21800:109-759(-)
MNDGGYRIKVNTMKTPPKLCAWPGQGQRILLRKQEFGNLLLPSQLDSIPPVAFPYLAGALRRAARAGRGPRGIVFLLLLPVVIVVLLVAARRRRCAAAALAAAAATAAAATAVGRGAAATAAPGRGRAGGERQDLQGVGGGVRVRVRVKIAGETIPNGGWGSGAAPAEGGKTTAASASSSLKPRAMVPGLGVGGPGSRGRRGRRRGAVLKFHTIPA